MPLTGHFLPVPLRERFRGHYRPPPLQPHRVIPSPEAVWWAATPLPPQTSQSSDGLPLSIASTIAFMSFLTPNVYTPPITINVLISMYLYYSMYRGLNHVDLIFIIIVGTIQSIGRGRVSGGLYSIFYSI